MAKGLIMMYFFAMVAGVLTVLSMVMNSRLSRSIGVFQGVFVNFAVGLLTSLALTCLWFVFDHEVLNETVLMPPWYAYFGAILAIGVVASCNVVIPKIPVVYSAVLIFLGQIVTGLIIDALILEFFDVYKVLGALLIGGGLFLNARIDAEKSTAT